MNFDEYEKKYETQYGEFSCIVREILEKAINGAEGIPRPQSIQCRAKEASRLKPKLKARGLLDSSSIEDEIKDLAGARLIFFTNTDVESFLNSRLIPENFEVHWDQTRIHHPTVSAFPDTAVGSACTSTFSGLAWRFAVGTAIAGRPPPRSGLAQLRHPAPTLDV